MKWCDPWATALCLYKHPSARHFHLYFWFIVPQAQSSGLLVAEIYGFFTWKANLCGSWVLPAFGSLIFEGRKDGFSGTWILLIEEIGEIRVGVFFRWSLDYRIEIFRFDVGWTGENDKKDMSTDIYKNIKDQRKKLQIQVSVPCLKPKLKKEKGKTKEEGKKKKKKPTQKTPSNPKLCLASLQWNICQVTSGLQQVFLVVIGDLQGNPSWQCVKTDFVILICLPVPLGCSGIHNCHLQWHWEKLCNLHYCWWSKHN